MHHSNEFKKFLDTSGHSFQAMKQHFCVIFFSKKVFSVAKAKDRAVDEGHSENWGQCDRIGAKKRALKKSIRIA
jgi:hypothetical protein